MGYSSHWTQKEIEAGQRAKRAQERAEDDKRMILADKITLMVAKHIEDKLIRPGPQAEERECYDMANELRQMMPEISALISNILKTEKIVPN